MNRKPLIIRDLAKRLLEHHVFSDASSQGDPTSIEYTLFIAQDTFDTLRLSLTKTVGVVGFQALMSRALALAKQQITWLNTVHVKEDGSLEGLLETGQLQSSEIAFEGCTELLEHLLRLLVTFVGEDLTLLLVRDVWPDILSDPLPQVFGPTEVFPDNRLPQSRKIVVDPMNETMDVKEKSE